MSLDERQRAGVVAPPSKLPLVLVAIAVLAVIGGIAWFLLTRPSAAPADTANAAATANMAAANGTADAGAGAGRGELLPSGLRIEMIRQGNGPLITRADGVLLRYELNLPGQPAMDGNMDAAQGVAMTLNQVGPGFAEGLSRMRPGGIARFWLTARLAYGPVLPAGAPFQLGDRLEFLVRIEQVGPGRAAEVEANTRRAAANAQHDGVQNNLATAAPSAGGR